MSAQENFYELADHLQTRIRGAEFFTAWFVGEDSTFCRLNHAKIRQVGDVTQSKLKIRLIDGQRSVEKSISLSGDTSIDKSKVAATVDDLRKLLPGAPEDPYLLYSTTVQSTEHERASELAPTSAMLDHIMATCAGEDLVGILAAGPIFRGFANSAGQRNWHSTANFHFDYSLYHATDKAVKGSYAGFQYDEASFVERIEKDREQLAILRQPAKDLKPGKYRAYLAPDAMNELTNMLCWGGFGKKSHMTKRTALLKMIENGQVLNPAITIQENTAEGVAPAFNANGYVKPDCVELISAGRSAGTLISPRSAKEYGVDTNGAESDETPQSVAMAAGTLRKDEVLSELDTGIYINNLWYLNFSDRQSCRLTGMTRFAAFWVEGGKIKDPLNVMRFDDTIYRLFGDQLVGLTEQRDFLPSPSTYGGRSVDSAHLPGAVVAEMSLTL